MRHHFHATLTDFRARSSLIDVARVRMPRALTPAQLGSWVKSAKCKKADRTEPIGNGICDETTVESRRTEKFPVDYGLVGRRPRQYSDHDYPETINPQRWRAGGFDRGSLAKPVLGREAERT